MHNFEFKYLELYIRKNYENLIFKNTHRDESNDILYDIIYLCILVEKYSQSKLDQNCTFSNRSSIAGRREYDIDYD